MSTERHDVGRYRRFLTDDDGLASICQDGVMRSLNEQKQKRTITVQLHQSQVDMSELKGKNISGNLALRHA